MPTLQTKRIVLSAAPAPSLSELMRRFARLVLLAHQRIRQRRALARLDARLLRDIGVSPEQARRETAKPFWRE